MNKKQKEYLDRYKELLLDIIHKKLPDCRVYLFGSRARRDHDSGSDIDLALDAGKKIDFKIILKLLVEIEETKIPLGVDLVDLNTVSDEFKKRVNEQGILWEN